MKSYFTNFTTFILVFLTLFTFNLTAQEKNEKSTANVRSISNQQVLLSKIFIPEGFLATKVSSSVNVSYRAGSSQKFWKNLAIAASGILASTQIAKVKALPDLANRSDISLALPLGVGIAAVPGIWKNRPLGVPKGGLYLIHRDLNGKLINSWEQPISREAKNSVEFLNLEIDTPLSSGTLEVYLQNGNKNEIFYWDAHLAKELNRINIDGVLPVDISIKSRTKKCPSGFILNSEGVCCDPSVGNCKTELINIQTDLNDSEKSDISILENEIITKSKTFNRIETLKKYPKTQTDPSLPRVQNVQVVCVDTEECIDVFNQVCVGNDCSDWEYQYSICSTKTTCSDGSVSWSSGGGSGGGSGSGGTTPSKPCINGRDTDGMPCGASICGSNLRDQYGNPCGSPICNNGYTQYGIACSSLSNDLDRLDRRVSVTNLCEGYRRLWYNSFRNNDPLNTREMGGLITSDNRIILLPSYGNNTISVNFRGTYYDSQNRPILHVFDQQGMTRATVVTYDLNGNPFEQTFDITATVHTHPFTQTTTVWDTHDGQPATVDGNQLSYPSDDDINLASYYSNLNHYIISFSDILTKYDKDGNTIISNIPCLD